VVSIPQSGFGAFEPVREQVPPLAFVPVSIPQSGFGAFEPVVAPFAGALQPFCFNPSVGIRGV